MIARTKLNTPGISVDPLPQAEPEASGFIPLLLRDGLDRPISDLPVFVTLPSGQICEGKTCAKGAITLELPPEPKGQATIEVLDHKGQRQQVAQVELSTSKGASAIVLTSPKVKAELPLRPLHNPPTAARKPAPPPAPAPKPNPNPQAGKTEPAQVDLQSPWWRRAVHKAWGWVSNEVEEHPQPPTAIGFKPTVLRALSQARQPVCVVVGPECPNPLRLRLGRNNVYADAIKLAAKRLGLIPQAICALIDCEAAKLSETIPLLDAKGKPRLDKKGKPMTTKIAEVWNANSGNAQSGAAGLTQFLASTWLGHVMVPGRYIHEQSKANGWIRQEDVKGKGKNKDKVMGKQWMFVLSDGTTTTSPLKHRNDSQVQKCLAMRMDPTWSILAAADYGAANLALLKKKGFKIDALQDMDKAKLMYLMHHEGEGAGPAFISDTLAETKEKKERLRSTFEKQLGGKGKELAEAKVDAADGDVEAAYRHWLGKYVDDQFGSSSRFFCSAPQVPSALSDLLVAIGGTKIAKVLQ